METIESEECESFSDWMSFHDFSIDDLTVFKSIPPPQFRSFDKDPDITSSGYEKEEAWELCADALANLLPEFKGTIHDIRDYAPHCLSALKGKTKRAYTVDQGLEKYPFISCYYQGSVSDLAKMVHEFSHAVQIVISQDLSKNSPLMPPLYRECCAFLGEISLTVYLQKENTRLHQLLKKTWFNDDLNYLSTDLKEFKLALEDIRKPYSYRWNYPIARIFAVLIWKTRLKNKSLINSLFASGKNASDIVPIRLFSSSLLDLSNPLPVITQSDKQTHRLSKIEILGAVTALYLNDAKQRNQSILKFHQRISMHLKNESLFLYIRKGKPAGYACWNKKDNGVSFTECFCPYSKLDEFEKAMREKTGYRIATISILLKEKCLEMCA